MRALRLSTGILLAAATLLAACGGGGTANKPANVASASGGLTPAANGELDSFTWWVYYRAPFLLDPIKVGDYPDNMILGNMCEPLWRQSPGFKFGPALATSYKTVKPTRIVYQLRHGVKFWDGSAMTAEDAAFSLQRNLDPKNGTLYGHFFGDVRSVKATGPYEVTVDLKRPNSSLPRWLVGSPGFVISKKYFEAKGDSFGNPQGGIMCTGPFKLDNWDQNRSLTIVRNPGYWNPELRPKVAKVTFVWPSASGTVTNGFKTGDFDGGFAIQPDQISSLQGAPGKLYQGSPSETLSLEVIQSTGTGPMASRLVRQALSKSLDREGIAKTIYAGAATPIYTPAHPGFWSYGKQQFAAAYKKYATGQDIEGAKRLVQQAGAIAKQPLVLMTNADNSLQLQEASVIKQNAAKAGLNVKIRALPSAQYSRAIFQGESKKNFAAVLAGQYEYVAEPTLIYTDAADPLSSINLGFNDPKVTAALYAARSASTEAERIRLTLKVQDLVMHEMPWITVVAPLTETFVGKRIAGPPTDFTYLMYPWASLVGAP
jgi:peptide/nickel transport system substrate-binding protein